MRGIGVLGATAVLLAACASPAAQGPANYNAAQAQIFHDYLPYAYAVLVNSKVIYGGVIQPDQFATDARWAELETQAKGLCDEARADGWESARASLSNSLSDAASSGIETRVYEIPLIAAATTVGSFCPDLAEGALPAA
jgi:hypothetical protein